MVFTTKYDLGQEVYMVVSTRKRVLCSACKGVKTVRVKGVLYQCRKCEGTGVVNEYQPQVQKRTIGYISVYANASGRVDVGYGFGEGGSMRSEEHLYPTEEAALEAWKCEN